MFIPKSKYSTPKHTPGNEFTLNGENYRGWYVELNSGGYFTGKTITSKSKKLIFNPARGENEDTRPSQKYRLYNMDVTPLPADISNKKWRRYFLQDKRNLKIVEVDRARYNLFRIKQYVTRVSLDWLLNGPAEDKIINGYSYEGTASRNKKTVVALEKDMPGISSFIKDYSQFVE
jgi:hypothetical protein